MNFSFKDIYVSRDLRFSVGIEEKIKRYYVSFLISTINRQSDYEIYYWLPESYSAFINSDPDKIYSYILECCKGFHKDMEIGLS